MTKPNNEPDKSPKTQDDQPDKGAVGSSQQTGKPGRERSTPQGSEPATRGNSQAR
jgi:hypothetical protein